MKNNQKSFANTVLIVVLVILVALVSYFAWSKKSTYDTQNQVSTCFLDQEATPVIFSVSKTSVSVGDIIKIHGCNLLGFEGDKNIWIENKDGVKGILYGKRDDDNKNLEVTMTSSVCEKDTSYSGLPCDKSLTLTPGMYKIFVIPWGKESNKVSITIK